MLRGFDLKNEAETLCIANKGARGEAKKVFRREKENDLCCKIGLGG